ncbi:MAG: 2OG-Fe(II) oxygenase [Candidatus Sedimenticola endophacoides]
MPAQNLPEERREKIPEIVNALYQEGWCVQDGFLPERLFGELRTEAGGAWHGGSFQKAGVGRGGDYGVRPAIRGDSISWLDPGDCTPAQGLFFTELEKLQREINRQLFLGLFDFESHFAVFTPGSFYQRHFDQFRGIGLRTVTCILYLNEAWQSTDQGALRMYHDPANPGAHVDILPEGNRLVCFLSARFEHEVLAARRERMSLTTWFRVRDPKAPF